MQLCEGPHRGPVIFSDGGTSMFAARHRQSVATLDGVHSRHACPWSSS